MGDIIFANHRNPLRPQTFIIPLTFPDISAGADLITRIGYGGDIWEMRADLLTPSSDPIGKTNLPPLDYVRQQVELLQKLSDMPILFTIRTFSQGGKFPDASHKEALALMQMAIAAGCQYIDVEIEWPQSMIDALAKCKGETKIIASYHSWTGDIRWTSQELRDKYHFADTFGDIVKLSILASSVYDAHELALFVRQHESAVPQPKPLLAVGMGPHGQLSRVLSPISLVTHRLVPFPSAPGQLTLAEVNSARHLLGQLRPKTFVLIGDGNTTNGNSITTNGNSITTNGNSITTNGSSNITNGSSNGAVLPVSAIANAFTAAFQELGMPHKCSVVLSTAAETELPHLLQGANFGGAVSLAKANVVNAKMVDTLTATAKESGLINKVGVEGREPAAGKKPRLLGDRVTWTPDTRDPEFQSQLFRIFREWTGYKAPELVMKEVLLR